MTQTREFIKFPAMEHINKGSIYRDITGINLSAETSDICYIAQDQKYSEYQHKNPTCHGWFMGRYKWQAWFLCRDTGYFWERALGIFEQEYDVENPYFFKFVIWLWKQERFVKHTERFSLNIILNTGMNPKEKNYLTNGSHRHQ